MQIIAYFIRQEYMHLKARACSNLFMTKAMQQKKLYFYVAMSDPVPFGSRRLSVTARWPLRTCYCIIKPCLEQPERAVTSAKTSNFSNT